MYLTIKGNLFLRILFPVEIKDFIKRLFAWDGPLTVLRADLFGFLVLMESSSLSTELIRARASSASILWGFIKVEYPFNTNSGPQLIAACMLTVEMTG